MAIFSSHIFKLTAASIITFCTLGGTNLDAQEIIMPERWSKSIFEVEPLFASDTLTILVAGDMMMHANQILNAHRGGQDYDFSSYFHLIQEDIETQSTWPTVVSTYFSPPTTTSSTRAARVRKGRWIYIEI